MCEITCNSLAFLLGAEEEQWFPAIFLWLCILCDDAHLDHNHDEWYPTHFRFKYTYTDTILSYRVCSFCVADTKCHQIGRSELIRVKKSAKPPSHAKPCGCRACRAGGRGGQPARKEVENPGCRSVSRLVCPCCPVPCLLGGISMYMFESTATNS